MREYLLYLLLATGLGGLLSCTAPLPPPSQPSLSEPFAILNFSGAMRLIELNDQRIESRLPLRTLRVRPGSYELRFVHLNEGPEGSATHAGQTADPFPLDVHAGITYEFEAKT